MYFIFEKLSPIFVGTNLCQFLKYKKVANSIPRVRISTTHLTILIIDPHNDSSLFAKNLVKVGQAPPKIPTIMTDDMYTLVKKVAYPEFYLMKIWK